MSNRPYVYKLTHKTTGQFYIGHRWANKYPAHLDIGIHYFSSSSKVKKLGFENFDIQILFESISTDRDIAADHAYDVENEMISEVYDNSLCLNGQFRNNSGVMRFKHDPTGLIRSAETREKLARANIGKRHTEETKSKMADKRKGQKMNFSDEVMKRRSEATRKQNMKRYRLTSPDGIIFEGIDLKKFCMEKDLNQGNMAAVCRGIKKHHKGWVGIYVE